MDPGQPFPADTGVTVNSPVDASVNRKPAPVINAIGWPGLIDTYRIDFQVPAEAAKGMAAIQIRAAWISSAPVAVMVQ